MKYKLLAIDMDGTFLNDEKAITEGNLNAVRKTAEKGVKVVVCSGRNLSGLKPLLKYMPSNQPIIAVNGSIIFDYNKAVIYSNPLENHTVLNIIDFLREEYNDTFYQFFHGNASCSERFEGIMKTYYERNQKQHREYRMELRIVADSKKYIEDNNAVVSKLEIHEDNAIGLEEIREKLEKLIDIEIVSSGAGSIEITKKDSNKGLSLEILAKHYNYSLEECIAVGNDENDLEMIKKAGLGIAVKNARDNVKEAADYITLRDNNNDAIAEVIEKFI